MVRGERKILNSPLFALDKGLLIDALRCRGNAGGRASRPLRRRRLKKNDLQESFHAGYPSIFAIFSLSDKTGTPTDRRCVTVYFIWLRAAGLGFGRGSYDQPRISPIARIGVTSRGRHDRGQAGGLCPGAQGKPVHAADQSKRGSLK